MPREHARHRADLLRPGFSPAAIPRLARSRERAITLDSACPAWLSRSAGRPGHFPIARSCRIRVRHHVPGADISPGDNEPKKEVCTMATKRITIRPGQKKTITVPAPSGNSRSPRRRAEPHTCRTPPTRLAGWGRSRLTRQRPRRLSPICDPKCYASHPPSAVHQRHIQPHLALGQIDVLGQKDIGCKGGEWWHDLPPEPTSGRAGVAIWIAVAAGSATAQVGTTPPAAPGPAPRAVSTPLSAIKH